MEAKDNAEQTLKVVIRVRPLNRKEVENGNQSVWHIDSENNCIAHCNKRYAFDRVYSPSHTTKDIYNESMSPVIKAFVGGFNGCIFAYGQTSSGKTYTMMGGGKDDGIIHKTIKYIFRFIQQQADREFVLNVAYLEIYNESIKDLLSPQNVDLKISMDNFHRPIVKGLTTESIFDREQIFKILSKGMSNRNIGSTKMNEQSSRSHTIFQITLESRQKESASDFDGSVRSSILNIVDLAGSERAKKTEASGFRLKEGAHINKSLLTLGIVIKKLSDVARGKGADAGHIPYRDSKLTHILEPALGGNSKTVVICTMTNADIHVEESTSTLKFATRAKEVKNNATVEEIIDQPAIIKRQERQIMELQRRLMEQRNNNNSDDHSDDNCSEGIVHNNIQNANMKHSVDSEAYEAQKAEYEKKITRLKELCKKSYKMSESEEEDSDITKDESIIQKKTQDEASDFNPATKRKSVLGKRRRHSVAIDLEGTPARKRLKTQIYRCQPRARHSSYATPITKIRIENDQMVWKLRKATHISKGLQQELNAKYRDFSEMQMEIDRLNEVNHILSQKVDFFEHNIGDDKQRNHVMENQRLTLKMNELQLKVNEQISTISKYEDGVIGEEKKEREHKLQQELQHSQTTIEELQYQISELRLSIEQQQKIADLVKVEASSREMSLDATPNSNQFVLLQMNLSKLQSQLILIKNDKASLQQIINREQQQWISLKKECLRQFDKSATVLKQKLHKLENALDESNDEKRLFESQYHQIREERDEMISELQQLRRPENEIMDELQSELLNIQKQSDIDSNHTSNVNQQMQETLMEIDNLKEINEELKEQMTQREKEINHDWNSKMNAMKQETEQWREVSDKLENDLKHNTVSQMQLNKIDGMNMSQLKDTLKTMKRTLREQQSKMSAIQRKKDVHEKTAGKYNKRCTDLEQRFKKLSREHNHTKSQLMSIAKLNKRLKTKNDKLQTNAKKMQNESINGKDLNRKLNIVQKRMDVLQKKHDAKTVELDNLKLKSAQNEAEMKTVKQTNAKLENDINAIQREKNETEKALATEKDVVLMLQTELKKFHQINGQQSEQLQEAKGKITKYEENEAKLSADLSECKQKLNEVERQLTDGKHKYEGLKIELKDLTAESKEKEEGLIQQNESLKLSLSAMKETDTIQRNEIDETNKLLREIQIELNENKKELREYQNRWQYERKANDENIEKLRQFELKTNTLLHENQMNKSSIESKAKEIERLNTNAKEQQQILLQTMSQCADYKSRCESNDNEIDKLSEENQLLLKEKERCVTSMENKQKQLNEMKSNHMQSTDKLQLNEKKLNDANIEIADLKHSIQQMTKKSNDWQNKYQSLKQNHNDLKHALDSCSSEINDLKENINEMKYTLNKKCTQLTEATDALCHLEKELEIKKEVENERNSLEIKYNKLLNAYENAEAQLKSLRNKWTENENNMKELTDKLVQAQLQNEQLKDDNNNNCKSNKENRALEKKYAKAKECLGKWQENDTKLRSVISKKEKREEKYENAIIAWKQHCASVEKQLEKQKVELENLRPSKKKARNFQKLCDEYHYAKNQIFKANLICRETQTIECKLKNKENKENINQNNK